MLFQLTKWAVGLYCISRGIATIESAPISAILFMILGVVITPWLIFIIEIILRKNIESPIKWAITVLGFVLIIIVEFSHTYINKLRGDKIVTQASALIDSGDIARARLKIKEADSIYRTSDNNAKALELEINLSQSIEYITEQLCQLSDEEYAKLRKGEFYKDILSQKTLNNTLIELMYSNAPKRAQALKEKARRAKEEALAEAERKVRNIQEEYDEKRQKLIRGQFKWDGSHSTLTKLIKKSLYDPDSYNHIETTYIDKGNTIIVTTTFNSTNRLGVRVARQVVAKVDLYGDVLDILHEE